MIFLRHPRESVIREFAADELPPRDRRSVSAHLVACDACRREYSSLKSILTGAPSLPGPAPTSATLESALQRRASGERIILPSADPVTRDPGNRAHIGATAAAAVLLFVLFLWGSRPGPLTAGSVTGELRVVPAHPRPGDSVIVTYEPSASLASANSLRLRSRLRTSIGINTLHGVPGANSTELRRQADGSYQGVLHLPDSVVYAALAVEDTAGVHVDTHLEALWNVLAGDDRGVPRLEALRAHVEDASTRNWEQALATAREMVRLHPMHAESWYTRLWMEAELVGSDGQDSLRRSWSPVLERMHDSLQTVRNVSSSEMRALWRWAEMLQADSLVVYWTRRIRSDWPESGAATELRLRDAATLPRPERAAAYEHVWQQARASARPPALGGLFLATQMRDADAIRRWGDRAIAEQPHLADMVASELARTATHRDEGVARIRARLLALSHGDDTQRRLEHTRAADADRRAADIRGLLTTLGMALRAEGKFGAARDTLELGTRGGWDPRAFITLGDLHLLLGDTAAATRFLAMAAVDPGPSRDSAIVRRGHLGDRVTADAWNGALVDARQAMRSRVLETSIRRALPAMPRLADRAGKLRPLNEITGGRVAFVAYWSRFCGPSLADLAALQRTAIEFDRQGVPVLAITSEPPSRELDDFLKSRGLTFPVYHDLAREGSAAFGAHGSPYYYVLGVDGAIRFRPGSPTAAPRQVEALRPRE